MNTNDNSSSSSKKSVDLGISQRAISLARIIDRLPKNNKFVIHLDKPDEKEKPWQLSINIEGSRVGTWTLER